ncbi:MAG: zinc-ribbon domain-containing protein [Lachnospiraceae bacterium]|nr:zinc-ribbon domain-containing protein [Lachnospiraceae bacterium]
MFCTKCGNKLPDNAKFCVNCGNPVVTTPTDNISTTAPVESVPMETIPVVDTPAKQPQSPSPSAPAPQEQGASVTTSMPMETSETSSKPQEFRFTALNEAGEAVYGTIGNTAMNTVTELIPGPWKTIGTGIRQFFSSLRAVLKNPKSLIPAVVLAIVWLVLNLLQVNEVDAKPVQAFSFLTFANGGMSGGFLGAIGGIIGKGIFAGAITTLLGSLLRKNTDGKRSFKDTLSGTFGVSLDSLWAFLAGAGAAMLLYLFLSGGTIRLAFMGGIAAAYLAAKSVLNNGFLHRLISSFTSKGKAAAGPGAAGFVRGLTVGFLAAAFLGLTDVNLILIILGAVLFIGGVVMMILQAKGIVKLGKGEQKA